MESITYLAYYLNFYFPILAAQKQVNEKQPSKPAAKKARNETKPAQSKHKATKIKTDMPKRSKRTETPKRQSTHTSTPSSGPTRNSTKVRFNGSRNQTPKTSVTSSGLSNSAPPSKPVRWPAALTKKCERLLDELMDHEDSWPFLTPVDQLEVYHVLCVYHVLSS